MHMGDVYVGNVFEADKIDSLESLCPMWDQRIIQVGGSLFNSVLHSCHQCYFEKELLRERHMKHFVLKQKK